MEGSAPAGTVGVSLERSIELGEMRMDVTAFAKPWLGVHVSQLEGRECRS